MFNVIYTMLLSGDKYCEILLVHKCSSFFTTLNQLSSSPLYSLVPSGDPNTTTLFHLIHIQLNTEETLSLILQLNGTAKIYTLRTQKNVKAVAVTDSCAPQSALEFRGYRNMN